MVTSYFPGRSSGGKGQLEKQLFKDVQKLIRYIEARKHVSSDHDELILQSYERMVQERCDALSNIARR